MNRDVITRLAVLCKQASAPQPALLEKDAFLGKLLRTIGGGSLGKGLGRSALGGAAAAGTGAYGLSQAKNMSEYTPGRSMNPTTWLDPQDRGQAFGRAAGHYNQLNQQANNEIDAAHAAGNHDYAQKIQDQVTNRTYNGNQWNPFQSRIGGLNPWGNKSMDESYGAATGIQAGDKSAYNQLQQRMNARGSKMSPNMRANMNTQMQQMQARMNDTRLGGGGGGEAFSGGYPVWGNIGHRPNEGNGIGAYLNPNDYKPNDVWNSVLRA